MWECKNCGSEFEEELEYCEVCGIKFRKEVVNVDLSHAQPLHTLPISNKVPDEYCPKRTGEKPDYYLVDGKLIDIPGRHRDQFKVWEYGPAKYGL